MNNNSIAAILFFLVLLGTGSTRAGDLCDSDCQLSISFPSGGSIEAIEALTITFGDSGLVDTSGSVTAYLVGQTLDVNAVTAPGLILAVENSNASASGIGIILIMAATGLFRFRRRT